jgi:hypothetical protein
MNLIPQALADRLRHRVIWEPLPGSQELALNCPCNQLLYSGTRGPGKTDAQLMSFRSRVGQGYGQFWRGVIFDRKYKNLDDIISKSRRWFPQFQDGARFLSSGALKWVWPTGEELLFRHMRDESDYWNYHGQEFPWIGWNELTKYPTSQLYDSMMSCNRSSFVPIVHSPGLTHEDKDLLAKCQEADWPLEDMVGSARAEFIKKKLLPDIPLEVFTTTNPYGAGHNWVKRRFVDPAPPGKIVKTTRNIFNPRTQQREDVTRTHVHLRGSWMENKYLPPEYILSLTEISDVNKRKAWLKGDWDIVAGGALDDVWFPLAQVKPRFTPPHTWRLDRSFDWGSTHPFYVAWWAKANGEEAQIKYPGGRVETFCPPAGSLILINEWYGTHEIGTNDGLKLSAVKVALGIKEREAAMRANKQIWGTVYAGPADNQISNVNESGSFSIEKTMAMEGVAWKKSDKSPGSRKNGLELMRVALENSVSGDRPGLFFMDNCRAALSTLPTLPRDEDDMDDVDTEAEDHPYDAIRYRILSAATDFATTVPISMH